MSNEDVTIPSEVTQLGKNFVEAVKAGWEDYAAKHPREGATDEDHAVSIFSAGFSTYVSCWLRATGMKISLKDLLGILELSVENFVKDQMADKPFPADEVVH